MIHVAQNKFTTYFPPEKEWLLAWAKKHFGQNLSKEIRDHLYSLWKETKPPTTGAPDTSADTNHRQPGSAPDTTTDTHAIERLYNSTFGDITDDTEFINLLGTQGAANAIRTRLKNLKTAHPETEQEIYTLFCKRHKRLAALTDSP